MVQIRRSIIVGMPAGALWAILRDFNGHESWHPAVAASEIEDGMAGDQPGAVRDFRLADGSPVREQLLALSDTERSFSYCILEAPVPLLNYVATVRLRPITSEDTCLWEWRAVFDAPASQRDQLERFVADSIIEAGFRALTAGRIPKRPPDVQPAGLPSGRGAAGGVEAKAIVLTRYGGPEALDLQSIRVRDPGPGEVRIRQTAVGVNFIDVYCRRGSFDLVKPPGIIGMEAAGIVESAGAGLSWPKPGDRAGYACAPPGAYTSMRTMEARLLIPLPDFLPDVEAAALLLKGMTASFLLHDVYKLQPGDTILVHAAAGGVGQILCRWAKALGATVIGATSTPAKAELAKRAGCDHIIDYTQGDFRGSGVGLEPRTGHAGRVRCRWQGYVRRVGPGLLPREGISSVSGRLLGDVGPLFDRPARGSVHYDFAPGLSSLHGHA